MRPLTKTRIFPFQQWRKATRHALKPNRVAFTLVELLVVVGIVGILAAITLPAVLKSLRNRDDLRCLSNLKTIGSGIQSYAMDNNGSLPGPLYAAQYPNLGSSYSHQLTYHLGEYLNLNLKSRVLNPQEPFVCPAFYKAPRKTGLVPAFVLNISVPLRDRDKPQQLFGYPNRDYPTLFGNIPNFPVMKIHQFSEIVDSNGFAAASRTWMLKDIDQQDPWLQNFPLSASPSFPQKPVHGDHRNALFFDFHVEAVDREQAK